MLEATSTVCCKHGNTCTTHTGRGNGDSFDYGAFLLQIGDGTYPESSSAELPPHSIRLPSDMVLHGSSAADFVTKCLGEKITHHKVGHHMLAPKHEDVDLLNDLATDRMVETEVTYKQTTFKCKW